MKKKLIYKNDVPEQFGEQREYIKEVIADFFDALDVDCEIKIEFIDSVNLNEFECTDCTLKNISAKEHELAITYSPLRSIYVDGGRFFCTAICHEFAHIRDFFKMMQTKLFRFNICKAAQKSFERQYVSVGYSFWTEVRAYYKTIDFANQNEIDYEKITFGRLVTNYNKTITLHKQLYYQKDLQYNDARKYTQFVDSFVYLCAKFMASIYARHSRIPYKKTYENKDYKKVYSILCGLEPKVMRIFNSPYCAKSYDNLYKLGKFICENLRWKVFKVGLIKKKGRICSFY